MRVGDLRQFGDGGSIITVGDNVSVLDATKTMAQSRIGAVLVMDGEKVAGIFTERDLMNRVVAAGLDSASTRIRDVMTGDVQTVKVDDAAIDCLESMASGNFRHMPVVDADDRPIGMLSQRDFMAATVPQALAMAGEAARATVSKRYQPFAIVASVVAYTLIVIVAVSLFL